MPDEVQEVHAEDEVRSIPTWIRRKLLNLQGKMYLPVTFRIAWFRKECPMSDGWGIETQIVEGGEQAGIVVVKAEVVRYTGDGTGRIVLAQAHKRQKLSEFPRGFIEKAEMGAIGRALALCGFGTQFTEDLEEDDALADSPLSVQRAMGVPEGAVGPTATAEVWEGPGTCPKCNAPAGKKHGTVCRG